MTLAAAAVPPIVLPARCRRSRRRRAVCTDRGGAGGVGADEVARDHVARGASRRRSRRHRRCCPRSRCSSRPRCRRSCCSRPRRRCPWHWPSPSVPVCVDADLIADDGDAVPLQEMPSSPKSSMTSPRMVLSICPPRWSGPTRTPRVRARQHDDRRAGKARLRGAVDDHGLVIVGRAEAGEIVQIPLLWPGSLVGMSKKIQIGLGFRLASATKIACAQAAGPRVGRVGDPWKKGSKEVQTAGT